MLHLRNLNPNPNSTLKFCCICFCCICFFIWVNSPLAPCVRSLCESCSHIHRPLGHIVNGFIYVLSWMFYGSFHLVIVPCRIALIYLIRVIVLLCALLARLCVSCYCDVAIVKVGACLGVCLFNICTGIMMCLAFIIIVVCNAMAELIERGCPRAYRQ